MAKETILCLKDCERYDPRMLDEMREFQVQVGIPSPRLTLPLRVGFLPASRDFLVKVTKELPEWSLCLWESAQDAGGVQSLLPCLKELRNDAHLRSRMLYDFHLSCELMSVLSL